jgi:hypothetical protein
LFHIENNKAILEKKQGGKGLLSGEHRLFDAQGQRKYSKSRIMDH